MDTLNPSEYASRVIKEFGGASALARVCKISPASVCGWRENGIPEARLDFLKAAFPAKFIEIDGKRPIKPRLESGRKQA